MSDWWTYRPSDFVLFSAGTYYRLVELYNAAIWPLQIAMLLAGVATVALLFSRARWRGRAIAAILAACWLWIAWAFHWQRYATINWAAPYFAALFALQAALLVWMGVVRDGFSFGSTSAKARSGVALFVFALIAQPLVGLAAGRTPSQVEIFGAAPDPTAVATIGALLAVKAHRITLLIPLLWCVASSVLWSAMSTADAFVLALAALVPLLFAIDAAMRRAKPSPSS